MGSSELQHRTKKVSSRKKANQATDYDKDEFFKQVEEEAKEDAISELAALLDNPEAMFKLERIRLEQQETLNLMKRDLKTLVQSQIDAKRNGIELLNEIHGKEREGYLSEIERCCKSAQKVCDSTSRLTSREDYRLIEEVSLARYNVKQTKKALQRLLTLQKGIEEVGALLEDDDSILNAYTKLRELEQTRDKILATADRDAHSQLSQIQRNVRGVAEEAANFDIKLRDLIENHYQLAKENRRPVLVKCMQIMHRERLERDKIDKAPTISQFPRKDKFKEGQKWIRNGIDSVFDRVLLPILRQASGGTGSSVSKVLYEYKEALRENLTFVKDVVEPSFPPYLFIFNQYCEIYHEKLANILKSWVSQGVLSAPDEFIRSVTWINETYVDILTPFSVHPSSFQTSLLDELSPLYLTIQASLKTTMDDLCNNLFVRVSNSKVSFQSEDKTKKEKEKDQQQQTPTDPGVAGRDAVALFDDTQYGLQKRLKEAVNTKESPIIQAVVASFLYALNNFHEQWLTTLSEDPTSFHPLFLMYLMSGLDRFDSLISDIRSLAESVGVLDTSVPTCDTVHQGYIEVISTVKSLASSNSLSEIQHPFCVLFGKDWKEADCDPSIQAISSHIRTFWTTSKNIIPAKFLPSLGFEVMHQIITSSILALYTTKKSFPRAFPASMEQSIAQLMEFSNRELTISPSVLDIHFKVLHSLKDLIDLDLASNEPSKLELYKNVVKSLRRYNADVTLEHLIFVIQHRSDLDNTQVNNIGEVIKRVCEENTFLGDLSTPSYFKGIVPPKSDGSFFNNLSFWS
eukprot:TRINITY_DN5390_c0_g1_i2.p1 TRINITY_DN5390_c0_g1~~TRINITY_DN5390_c0_g1_i2.p1  ORF type:complete len:833 (-),score=161.64 TRINITY_DN5390_c0_g1_i2:61-2460(-)